MKSMLPSGAVARPGVTGHLDVSKENGFRCSGVNSCGWLIDGGHLVVSQF